MLGDGYGDGTHAWCTKYKTATLTVGDFTW